MEKVVDSDRPLMSNGFVTCYSDYLRVHLYYFPFGSKKIKYSSIRSCDFRSTNDIGMFEYKLWGMSLSPIWWHCDMNRLGRKYYILLDASQWPQIGLTMDDNDTIQVYNLIKQKMSLNQPNISDEKLPHNNSSKTLSEKEIEHQKSMQNNKTN
jgi:hypothetical protein